VEINKLAKIIGPDMTIEWHTDTYKLEHEFISKFPHERTGIRKYFRVIRQLWDEMEKAHPQIMDFFLQILDAARITLGNGKTYDLTNYYIVFTSNIGANRIPETGTVLSSTLERGINAELRKNLRKEMIARFGAVIIFKQLGSDIQNLIAKTLLDKEMKRMELRGCELTYDDSCFHYIIRNGIKEGLGVRPLRDTIYRTVGDAVCEVMLRGSGKPKGMLTLDKENNKLKIV